MYLYQVNQYIVYILKCADNSYYTGVTNDLERRLYEHESGYSKTAYTFNRRPVTLVFHEVFHDVNQSIDFEKQIKGWKRVKKEALIERDWSKLTVLSNHNKTELELIKHLKKLNLNNSHSELARLRLAQPDNSSRYSSSDNTIKNTSVHQARHFKNVSSQKVEDQLVVEESLLINVNYKPFTLTMRSPDSEEELVRGLLFTENILPLGVDFTYNITEKKNGIITAVNVEINPKFIDYNRLDKRNLMSVSSCGICGKLELNEKCEHLSAIQTESTIAVSDLQSMFAEMSKHQKLFKKTGGCHASAAFDGNGDLLSIQEDIGRHNAVDKVIGELILTNRLEKATIILVSGRISYEIVTKVYMARIPFLAAVSSVSSLAVELAEDYGITMLGFCRGEKATCYTNSERIL